MREANPAVLLLVECGYKYRLFGTDAEVAAGILGIYASKNKSFSDGSSTASIPVHRLGVHVRRLVAHGLIVGVVKQTESAAVKRASATRSKAFDRKLVAMYSRSTLVDDDVIGVADNGGDGGSDNFRYIVGVCEDVDQVSSICSLCSLPTTGVVSVRRVPRA